MEARNMEARNMDLADIPNVLKGHEIRVTPLIPREDRFDGPVLEEILLAPGTLQQSGFDEAKKYLIENLQVSNEEAQRMLTFDD